MRKPASRPSGRKVRPKPGSSVLSNKGAACPYCNKRCYSSRKYAKQAAKIQYPSEHLSEYQCLKVPEHVDASTFWHIGHLAPRVVEGRDTRSRTYGSPDLVPAKPEKRGPIPAALRATIGTNRSGVIDEDEDKREGGPVPTIAETALVSLTGFDRRKGGFKSVNSSSPLEAKVALVHAALRAYAITHSFGPMDHNKRLGFVGHASLRAIVRELFDDIGGDSDKLDQLASAISRAGTKDGLFACLDSSQHLQGILPTWWIVADYEAVMGHAPLYTAPAPKPTAPKAAKKAAAAAAVVPNREKQNANLYPGRKKGTRNRTRIELLSLTERTLKALGRPVLLTEVYENADFPYAIGTVRSALDELAKERRIYQRGLTDEDRAALRLVGGPAQLSNLTKVVVHASFVDESKEVPVVTWGGRSTKSAQEPSEPVKVLEVVKASNDEPAVTVETEDEDDVDAMIAALEAKATAPKPTDEVDELRAKVAELEIRVTKLTQQRDRLLAVVETMKD